LDKEEQDFLVVRKFVRDHPGYSVLEVSEGTGIEEEKILQFLRDGRLRSKGFDVVFECERCGKKIKEGRYCSFCKEHIDTNLREGTPSVGNPQMEASPPLSRRKGERMHSKDGE